jgi:hypothetical protein
MPTYKEIKGTNVQNLSSDPANPIAGQIWYNTTSNALKISDGPEIAAWATGGNLNDGKRRLGTAGTQTAALGFGSQGNTALTESYNGTSWTEVNDLNTGRGYLAGAGADNTSALAFSGDVPGTPEYFTGTESWDGTSWTEVNDLNTGRKSLGGAGVQTSALAFGGFAVALPYLAVTESWNGTSWTEVNDLNTSRLGMGAAGTDNTSALSFGGTLPGATGKTESWNGSSWTEVNDLNTARRYLGGAGTNTAALGFGGYTPFIAKTESWNGSSWTEINDMGTARYGLGGAGTQTAALGFGGLNSSYQTSIATEEFSETGGTRTITAS